MQFHRVITRRKDVYGKLVPAGIAVPGISTTIRPVNPMRGYESCWMKAQLESVARDRRRVKQLFWYDPRSLDKCSEPIRRDLSDGLPRLNKLLTDVQPGVYDIQSFLLLFPDLPVVKNPERVFNRNYAKFIPMYAYRKPLFMCLLAIRSKWINSQLLPGVEIPDEDGDPIESMLR